MTEQEMQETVWCLIAGLSWQKETDKAIQFQIQEAPPGEDLIWLPKSQLHPFVLANSRYFVAVPQWLVDKRGLNVAFYLRGISVDLTGLRSREALWLERLNRSRRERVRQEGEAYSLSQFRDAPEESLEVASPPLARLGAQRRPDGSVYRSPETIAAAQDILAGRPIRVPPGPAPLKKRPIHFESEEE